MLEITWNKVKDHIKEQIPNQSFLTWFEPISLLALSDSTATLKVPNQFHYDWIKDKYAGIVEACFSEVMGAHTKVEYSIVIDEGKENDATPSTFTEKQNKYKEPEQQPIQFPTNLNKEYQFENFVEGPGNQFASAAAKAVVDSSDKNLYNPLVFYSGVGLGKTHLLHATGNLYHKMNPRARVYYVASDKFVRDFVSAIQTKTSSKFTKFYQSVDLLIVDDVQWFQGKERTVEEFFNIFNELYLLGKRIILATDRPPVELNLPNRLKSRFSAGLIVDIQKPDFETRLAILRQKSEESGIEISYDVMEYLSKYIDTNIRELQGALIRLLAYSSLVKQDISLDLAHKILTETLGKKMSPTITMDDVLDKVCDAYNMNKSEIIGRSRRQEIALARHVAMYLSKEYTRNSLKSIGLYFGKRDHSTVIHAHRTVQNKMERDSIFHAEIMSLSRRFSGQIKTSLNP